MTAAWARGLLLVSLWAMAACEGAVPADLDRAAKVIAYMADAGNLKRTSFRKHHPGGAPSSFVQWIFSADGKSAWPETEAEAERVPGLREQAVAKGMPLIPRKMFFSANVPQADQGRQLVVKADDAQGLLILEGYADPRRPPAVSRSIKWVKLD